MRNTCRIRRMVSLCAGIHPSIDCEARSRCEVDADPSGDVTPTRPNIGKVADFRSEWWPLSNRNGGPTSNRNAGRLHCQNAPNRDPMLNSYHRADFRAKTGMIRRVTIGTDRDPSPFSKVLQVQAVDRSTGWGQGSARFHTL